MDASAVQVVNCNDEDQSIIVDEEFFRSILQKDDVRNRNISVISIAGAFRQGKSFLLNFLLQYLHKKYVQRRDVTEWLTGDNGQLMKGFSWATGSKRHTTGILMWPEIFLANLPNGDKAAIMLLDTQGSFDHKSTITMNAKIFAFSTLISSVQIFNVMRNIRHDDLIYLQQFGGYGNLMSNTEDDAPFQDLFFLVRDWPYAFEKSYGIGGGSALLEDIASNSSSEVAAQFEVIQELFNRKRCFLLPHPGKAVAESPNFEGDLNEIDEEFKEHVQEFVETILSPENLVLKKINGQELKGADFMYYIEEYSKLLKEDHLPTCETMATLTVTAQHRKAYNQALAVYKKNMKLDCNANYNKPLKSSQLGGLHIARKKQAVDMYETASKIEDDSINEKYLNKLEEDIEKEFKEICKSNERVKARLREQAERQRIQLSSNSNRELPGTSTATLNGENIAIAAGVIGGVAAVAFGISKLFGSSKNNN